MSMSQFESGKDDARRQRGRDRMKEIAREDEAERQRVESQLVADFGRVPSAIEACVIEQIAARMVRARRLRQQGRDDTEQSRLIAQLLRSIGLKPAAPAAKPDPRRDLDELFAEVTAESEAQP
jgi:hypothetical protein